MTSPFVPAPRDPHDPWWDRHRHEMGGDSPPLRDREGPPMVTDIGPYRWIEWPDGYWQHWNRRPAL